MAGRPKNKICRVCKQPSCGLTCRDCYEHKSNRRRMVDEGLKKFNEYERTHTIEY